MPFSATTRFAERLAQTPPIWIAVWVGLAVLTVALAVLMRTRWGQSRPMQKCAVLSLLAHVVLACFATTIKIVASNSEGPARPAMHVALVDSGPAPRDESTRPTGENEAKPWDPRPSGPVVAPVIDPLEPPQLLELPSPIPADLANKVPPDRPADDVSDPSSTDPIGENRPTAENQPFDAVSSEQIESESKTDKWPSPPAKNAQPEAPPSTEIGTAMNRNETGPGENQLPDLDENRSETIDPVTSIPSRPPSTDPHQLTADVVPVVPPPLPTGFSSSENPLETVRPVASPVRRPPDAVFRYRTASARLKIARRSGGSGKTEGAVDEALAWLARAQSLDGRWSAARHGAGREQAVLGHDRRGAGLRADTGITGLALLAFLGAGHTDRHGNHRETVAAGIKYLVDSQNDDGNMAGDASLYAKTYCHAMATYALAEALAMTGDPTIEAAVARAAAYSIRSQHRAGGGWRYLPGNSGDTSQLGWQVMALRSAERAGRNIPDSTWRGIERFLRSVSFGRGDGLAGYRPGAAPSRTMTGEAAYCRQLVWTRSDIGGASRRNAVVAKGQADDEAARYLLTELPGDGRDNFYYWYYATLFLHGRSGDTDADGTRQSDWIRWNDALKSTLIARQQTHGPLAGSWSPDTVWGGYGGRVYSTALGTLCLEVYYRYARFENRIATQPRKFDHAR